MFKHVTSNTYIGKSKLNILDPNGEYIQGTTNIGNIATYIDKDKDLLRWPDYYIKGNYQGPLYRKGSSPELHTSYTFCINNGDDFKHYLFITGIPKGAKSIEPFKLDGCIWSSYYEDLLHGFLFQIINSNTTLKLQQDE